MVKISPVEYLKLPYEYCFRRAVDGTWVGRVAELPGLEVGGAYLAQTFSKLEDAMVGWIQARQAMGMEIPLPESYVANAEGLTACASDGMVCESY